MKTMLVDRVADGLFFVGASINNEKQSYAILSLSVHWASSIVSGLHVRFGIDNFFDEFCA